MTRPTRSAGAPHHDRRRRRRRWLPIAAWSITVIMLASGCTGGVPHTFAEGGGAAAAAVALVDPAVGAGPAARPIVTPPPRPTMPVSPLPTRASGSEEAITVGEKLRFVFLADSRGNDPTGLAEPVDTASLLPIIAAIGKLDPPPAFVMFGGDMSYRGYIYTKEHPTGYTFGAWQDLFAPLTAAGIPLYTAIGNHELYRHDDLSPDQGGFSLANQQEYQQVFSENPTNGPAGYRGLTYSFTSPRGDSFFAVLDPYYLVADTIPDGLGGNIDATQMGWLRSQVAASHATHKFLFIHTPYYYVSDDPEEPSAANGTLTTLWSFLDANKFDIYLCGHSHLYSRRTIDGSIPPDPQTTPPVGPWQNGVVQLLNGTSGAGPSTGAVDPSVVASWNVHNAPATYYFSVIDINGSQVSVNSYEGYTGAYTVFDSFTIDDQDR